MSCKKRFGGGGLLPNGEQEQVEIKSGIFTLLHIGQHPQNIFPLLSGTNKIIIAWLFTCRVCPLPSPIECTITWTQSHLIPQFNHITCPIEFRVMKTRVGFFWHQQTPVNSKLCFNCGTGWDAPSWCTVLSSNANSQANAHLPPKVAL